MTPKTLDRATIHHYIYILGLAGYIASIPTSRFVISLASILLLVNWISEGGFPRKWQTLKSQPLLLGLPFLFLLFSATLAYGTSHNYGFRHLEIKLPLLLLPIIIGTSKRLTFFELKHVVYVYLLALFVGTLIGTANYMQIMAVGEGETRNIYPVVSHIRFSLMLLLGALLSVYFFIHEHRRIFRISLLALVIWFIAFMFMLQSLTGLFALAAALVIAAFYFALTLKNNTLRWGTTVVFLIPILALATIFGRELSYFVNTPSISTQVKEQSAQGTTYTHFNNRKMLENGHYIWVNVAESELEQGWNKRSKLAYDGTDRSGQQLSATLIRYLTSKGLEKDAAAVESLEKSEITAIEQGETNVRFIHGETLSERIYKAIWEIDSYFKGSNPSSNPLAMRLVLLEAGTHIFTQHFWTGVGVDALRQAFSDYYTTEKPEINQDSRFRAHNQYLTFFITLGCIAGTYAVCIWFLPLFMARINLPFVFALGIIALSFINEDVLDTQFGISFTVFFYSLFLWGWDASEPPKIFKPR